MVTPGRTSQHQTPTFGSAPKPKADEIVFQGLIKVFDQTSLRRPLLSLEAGSGHFPCRGDQEKRIPADKPSSKLRLQVSLARLRYTLVGPVHTKWTTEDENSKKADGSVCPLSRVRSDWSQVNQRETVDLNLKRMTAMPINAMVTVREILPLVFDAVSGGDGG